MTRIFLRFTLLSAVLLYVAPAAAYNDQVKQHLLGPAIQQNATFQVQDPRYSEMQSGSFNFTNVKILGDVMLLIDLKTHKPTSDFTTTLQLSVNYDEWNGIQFVNKSTVISLSVNYLTEGVFKDKSVFRIPNAHNLSVQITQVTGPVEMLVLQSTIDITRYDHFDPVSAIATTVNSEFKEQRNELLVTWDKVTAAEEYDLEWTWVNDYKTIQTPRTPSEIKLDRNTFRINSSRVTVVGTQYAIPLLYDRGYIIYRVRAIGRAGLPARPIEGKWTYDPIDGHTVASAPHKFLFHGHQDNLNWQASISYAEEGKNKAAISYFDGSLRNRQAVSRLNSEDKIIVGETIYDHQGRPAVQVLPVPANTSKIGYQRSFNLNQQNKPYSREDFDVDTENCDVTAEGMSTSNGASQYYSPNNPDKTGAQAYLPDAQQYPFTQTEYTPDNTGRISRQSGVGPDHRLGSGHETKYFYGKPSQEELDRMFGVDVGYAKHYKKNMVMDANGQISVSYLDPQGKIIATALTGESPSNLISIAKPEETVTTTIDLLGKLRPEDRSGSEENLSPDGRAKTFQKEILVGQNSTYAFAYEVAVEHFTDDCVIGNSDPLCYGCVVDVSVSLTDECGNELIPPFGSDSTKVRQIGFSSTDCVTGGTQFESTFNTLNPLTPGSYSLTKKVSINEAALDFYTDDFIARQNDCLLTFDHFLEEESQNIQLFDCEADCQTCRDAVGSYGKYTGPDCNPCLTQEEYDNLLAECDFLCDDELVQCSNAYNMMLADVSPFGQYGEVMNAVGVGEDGRVVVPETAPEIDPSQFELSVFNEQNKLPKNKNGVGNWRAPLDGIYRDESGDPAMVDVLALEDEQGTLTFSPEIEADAVPAGVIHGSIFQVPPHKLVHVKDFIANWEPAWAQQLVYLHPEYGYYQFCNILENSHQWDTRILATDSYLDAVEKGFLPEGGSLKPNPLTSGSPLTDPYFSEISAYLETNVSSNWASYNDKEYQAISRSLNNYSENFDIWNVVHRTVNCPYDDSQSNVCQICPAYDGINTDEEWNTFKSLYFSLKQQFVERKTSLYAIANDCYNGCIGTQYYSPFSFSFYKHNVFDFIVTLSLLTDSDQPCNWRSWKSGMYEKKSKRFPLSTDMINISEMDLEACYTGFDETTPDTESLPPDQQVACSNTLRDILEDTKLEADISFYESCGQCPIVFDLQNLINAVAARKDLEKDNVLLSCYPESKYPEFVPDIKLALEETIPGDGKWYWDKVSSANGELRVDLTKLDNTGSCELRLKILTPGVAFSSIESICCMNYTDNPTFYPVTGNGNFMMRATVAGLTEKVVVEGLISCLDLTTCPFPPKCEPTKEASELQTMMNALLFDFSLGGTSEDLFSATPINLYEAPYKDVIEGTLDPLTETLSGTNWTWRAEITGNILTGYIEDGSGGRCMVELRPATNIPFDVTKILGFANIRPDRKHPDDTEHNFLITAIVETNQGTARVKMSGYSACLAIGTCVPVTE